VKRVITIAAIALVVVLVGGFGVYFLKARAMFNKIEIVRPGPTGRRIDEGGIFANYFPAKANSPAMLLLGGSEGGLGAGTRDAAKALQAEGFSVLTPSYFGAPRQPKHLELVPLETFDRALAWLRVQPEVDATRIAIAGVSKGAEAALLVATRHPELRGVFAGVPSSVVWPGIVFGKLKTKSSWTLHGRSLPFVPYGPFRFKMLLGDVGSVYTDGLKHVAQHEDAAIPIEKIKVPVLLVCGESDKLWPSCAMSRQLAARGGSNVTVLAYPNAGHLSVGPPLAESDENYSKLGFLGGTVAGNNAARAESWPKILDFARRVLS
jgi:dienelactone hydrolase